MHLAETSIFRAFADFLGIPEPILEYGMVGILVVAVIVPLVRMLFLKEREDAKQLNLTTQVVTLFGQTLGELGELKAAIEANTEAIKNAFEGLAAVVGSQVADSIEQVREELFGNRKIKVVVKDAANKVVAELHATPAVDESGERYLEIQYDLKKPDVPEDEPAG